jgi:hypothetical protein
MHSLITAELGTGIPSAVLTFSHGIQRAKVSAIRHIRCGNCSAPFEPGTMMKSPVPPNVSVALPPLVAAYVEATNSFDLERLLATFAEDALVNDQLRDYWGKPAVSEWAERDVIGARLTMNVTK